MGKFPKKCFLATQSIQLPMACIQPHGPIRASQACMTSTFQDEKKIRLLSAMRLVFQNKKF